MALAGPAGMTTAFDPAAEPFEDSRRLTGCNFHFAGTGAVLEAAPGVPFDDATLARWRDNVAAARAALGWPEGEVAVRRHRSGVSLAFAAPPDQLYAATEVNEWAWWNAVSFSPGEKVPEGPMREGSRPADASPRKKLPFDDEAKAFIRNLRRNATDAEHLVWSYVRGRRLHGQKFRRQQAMGPYVLDFYCHDLRLAIELDGGQHNEAEQAARDQRRDAFMAARGVRTLRYWNDEVMSRTDEVLADVWSTVDALVGVGSGDAASGDVLPSSALRAPSPGGRRGEQEPRLYHTPGHAAAWDIDSAMHTLQALAAAEANPALVALQSAATAHGLPCLPDDDEVSVGTGTGGRTWAVGALPDPDGVDWAALHAIPTALVTGSNGKTTTVRLVAAMARAHGWHTAHSCTDGVFLDGRALESGDYSGPTGARTALRQPSAQAAVLETARGGMLRRGLAVCHADVAVVTNVSADHFGEYGIHDLDDLAAAKLTVARAIGNDGLLVLNGDDATLRRQAEAITCAKGWFAREFDAPLAAAHRARGGATCGVRDGRLRLSLAGVEHDLGAIDAMPLTLGGRAGYNVANAAAAALAAAAMGIPPQVIAATLLRFGSDHGDNPGRLQRWRFGALEVYVDYAHNPDGLLGLLHAVGAGRRDGRLAVILGHAGNREDADLRAVAATAAGFAPELVVLKDIGGYERGRASGDIARIMRAALRDAGIADAAIETRLDEVEAARRPLEWARDGDLVVLPVHELGARAKVVALLDTLRASDWRPGMPLPKDQEEAE